MHFECRRKSYVRTTLEQQNAKQDSNMSRSISDAQKLNAATFLSVVCPPPPNDLSPSRFL